jgi:hypothetical protein
LIALKMFQNRTNPHSKMYQTKKIIPSDIQMDWRKGISDKTGKPWAIHKVKDQDNIWYSCFDRETIVKMQIGVETEISYNTETKNGFTNNTIGRPSQASENQEQIMVALRAIYTLLEKIDAKIQG